MREAGYLTSVYKNVYLDFGEVSVEYYTSCRAMRYEMVAPGVPDGVCRRPEECDSTSVGIMSNE